MQFLTPPTVNLIVVILEALILAGLFFGFYLIHYKRNRAVHEKNQTFWVLFNLVPILFVMVVTFSQVVSSPTKNPLLVGHGISGAIIELLAIYLILRMKNKLPPAWRVKNYKRLMQITLTLWTLQALGGFFIYYSLYVKG